MFREMRRNKQLLTEAETRMVLEKNTSGVLAVLGDEGYPYAVPLSYLYLENKIYFHGAMQGHKLDAIRNNEKVSFCIIDQDQVVSEKFTTNYRSVIAFGQARIIEDTEEKRETLKALSEKYSPDQKDIIPAKVAESLNHVCMVEIAIDHMTGKQGSGMVKTKG